ncbi:ParB/Sulfiredoxin [uncultured Caudovirales phage]|uniref:ParB/Sulfiredoxin n=1 Tax=uncultured Caudovirales phage TaxID=2100421 RepID=A0A6J5LI38_9CAUD|nr:ParB/Sulfiredoxin [uncultured Caudovirales phage]
MIQWQLQTVSIKDIKPHDKNPRQISKDQASHLENLIKKFGLIDKPILNNDFSLIGGHQRIKILKKMKVKVVECWVADQQLSTEDLEHLLIGLNLNQGSWDYDLLSTHFEALDLLKYGFTEKQLFDYFPEDEILEEEKKKKKMKKCPECGHEFS